MGRFERVTGSPEWVDQARRRVDRAAFCDPAIYKMEIDRVFKRSWLYLGHESEIEKPGDFVTRPMGDDQVIVVRHDDASIKVFLNSCTHRGMPVCRSDHGRTKRFICPYHAWTFDTAGQLRTTTYDDKYQHLDFAEHALLPVPRIETHRGLIFGNWDADACSLAEHLGEVAWYLDMLFARTPGGMKVIAPPQRWIIETNWKIPPMNFVDSAHAMRTHAGPMNIATAMGAPPIKEIIKFADASPLISFPEGHGVVTAPWSKLGFENLFGYPPEVSPLFEKSLTPDQMTQMRHGSPSVGTIFPNTSWVESLAAVDQGKAPRFFLSLRNWQPLDEQRIEVWNWFFAEAEASDETSLEAQRIGLQTFGIGGIFEEDDAEIWANISRAMRGSMGSKGYFDFSAGSEVKPLAGYTEHGIAHPSQLAEDAQFSFMMRWNDLMAAER